MGWKTCDGCQDRSCEACRYRRLKPQWVKHLSVMKDGKPWLKTGSRSDGLSIGCVACRAECKKTGVGATPWSMFEISGLVQLCSIVLHEKSKRHQQASSVTGGPSTAAVPTVDEFHKVLRAREEHKSLEAGVDGVATRKKFQRMQFCIAEARREIARKAMRTATTIVLHQDGRSPRLLTRFVTCSERLIVTRGSMPHAKHYRPDYRSVADETMEAIRIFCTPFHGAPPRPRVQVRLPQLDEALEGHIKKTVEVLSADAAASQQAVPDTCKTKLQQ
jgi:hypothetical protein